MCWGTVSLRRTFRARQSSDFNWWQCTAPCASVPAPIGRKTGIDLNGKGFPDAFVEHVERSKPPAVVQAVAHEIDRPNGIDRRRHRQRLAHPHRQSPFGPSRQVQAHFAAHPMNPLVFQPCPSLRNRSKHFQKPQRGLLSTTELSAPMICSSRLHQSNPGR